MSKNKRWRVFADPLIQGGLCLRVAAYWVSAQVVTFIAFTALASLDDQNVSNYILPAFIAGILILPFALLDLVVFSNKFAGPIHNFRRRFNLLAKGEETGAIKFRPGDYLMDLAKNYNAVRTQLGYSDEPENEEATEEATEEELELTAK